VGVKVMVKVSVRVAVEVEVQVSPKVLVQGADVLVGVLLGPEFELGVVGLFLLPQPPMMKVSLVAKVMTSNI
jgi:hypothetical protein